MTHTSFKSLRALIDVKEKIEIALHNNFIKTTHSYYEISSKTIEKFN